MVGQDTTIVKEEHDRVVRALDVEVNENITVKTKVQTLKDELKVLKEKIQRIRESQEPVAQPQPLCQSRIQP